MVYLHASGDPQWQKRTQRTDELFNTVCIVMSNRLIRIGAGRVYTDWRWKNRITGIRTLWLFAIGRVWLEPDTSRAKRRLLRPSLVRRSMARQEMSAALPLGEGAAALLGVLAGCLEVTLRNYSRQEPCCAARLRSFGSGLRANIFDSRPCVHPAIFARWVWSLDLAFCTSVPCARRLPNDLTANSADSFSYKSRQKNPWVNAGQCAFEEHTGDGEKRPDEIVFVKEKEALLDGGIQATAPPLFSRLRTSWPSRFR